MATFPHAFRKDFIGFGSVRTSGATEDLTAGQLGLFGADTFNALPVVTSNAKPNKMFIIAQGSMHGKDTRGGISHGGLQESVKSRPINPKYIDKFYVVNPSRPEADVWTIGYNGVSTCKPITGVCGAKYTIRVDVRGDAALRSYNRNLYRYFSVDTPCCDDCDVTCDPAVADPYLIGKSLVEQINKDVEISKFVKAELILETAIADANEATFVKYSLTVVDAGGPADLADVQNAYPTYKIARIGRAGLYSTYEVIKTSGLPTAYTPTSRKLPADLCGDCPVGWTLGSTMVLNVRRTVPFVDADDDGGPTVSFEDGLATLMASQATSGSLANQYQAAILATLAAIDADVLTADVTVTSTLVSSTNGVANVDLTITLVDATPSATPFTLTLSDLVVATAVTAVNTAAGGVDVDDEYTADAVEFTCTPPAGTSTAWVAGDSVYRTYRALCVTLPKNCGTTDSSLTAVSAYFSNNTDIVAASAAQDDETDCAEIITINQYSQNYYEKGCLEKPIPVYGNVPSFEGHVFVECACAPVASPYVSGAVGIRITAAYEDTKFGNCSFNPNDFYAVAPLKLEVTKVNDAELCTDSQTKWGVTHLNHAKAPNGLGETILRDYTLSMNYRGERFQKDPRWREVTGQEHLNVIDRDAYYKTYFLIHSIPNSLLRGMSVLNYDERYLLAFHFKEDVDTSAFEALVSGYAALNDVELEVY
jgi:hypothetical protein